MNQFFSIQVGYIALFRVLHFTLESAQHNIAQEERITTQVKEQQNLDWETMGYDMAGTGMGLN